MVIVFDVMGTLLNPAPLAQLVRRTTAGHMSAKQFFGEITAYAMASTLSGEHPRFESVASAVLQMAGAAHGRNVDETDIEKLRRGLRSMSPFPEVKHSLSRLRERGLRLAALSNANTELLEEQMKRSKLGKFFDEVISVDAVARRFKPSRDAYEGALDRLGGNPHEALMVAAHPWDLMGAAAAGFRTALIVRPGVAPYPGVQEPNYVAQNLEDFTDQLLGITQQSRNNTASWLLAGAGVGLALMKWGREPLFTACSKASPVEHH